MIAIYFPCRKMAHNTEFHLKIFEYLFIKIAKETDPSSTGCKYID